VQILGILGKPPCPAIRRHEEGEHRQYTSAEHDHLALEEWFPNTFIAARTVSKSPNAPRERLVNRKPACSEKG
jgi:hypothetical protein